MRCVVPNTNVQYLSPMLGRWLCAALILLGASGCVQRRLTIRSNPPGAVVYVDNYEIGTTPVSTDYIYYGTRNIRLVKDGFETVSAQHYFPSPWYQIPPLDFVSENVVPWDIRDERSLDFDLAPQVIIPTQALLDHGEELRRANQPAGVPPMLGPAPGPAMQPGGYPPPGSNMPPMILQPGSGPLSAPMSGQPAGPLQPTGPQLLPAPRPGPFSTPPN